MHTILHQEDPAAFSAHKEILLEETEGGYHLVGQYRSRSSYYNQEHYLWRDLVLSLNDLVDMRDRLTKLIESVDNQAKF